MYSLFRILLLFFLVISVQTIGQNKLIDSLIIGVKNAPNDSVKFRRLINLSHTLANVDTAKAWQYHREVHYMAQQSKSNKDLGMAYELAGSIHAIANPSEALPNIEKALSFFYKDSSSVEVKENIASAKNNLGINHYLNGDYKGALELFLETANIYERVNRANTNLSLTYNNIAILYTNLKNPTEAIKYSKLGLELAIRSGKKQNLMNTNLSVATVLISSDSVILALPYIEKSMTIATEFNNTYMIWSGYSALGTYYYKLKKYQGAILNYTKSLEVQKANGYKNGLAETFISIAAAYSGSGQTKLARINLDSAKKYFDVKLISYQKQIYFETLAEIYQSDRNYKLAMETKDSITLIRDSLYNEENIKRTEFINARFRNEQKTNEIERLESEKKIQTANIRQKRNLNYLLGVGSVALAVISLFGYRSYSNRQKITKLRIQELEREKQLAATEAVLKGEEQERTRLAKDLHDGLGGMLSGIKYSFNNMKENLVLTPENASAFTRSMDMLDNSIKEMRRVAHNMMPESLLRYGLDKAMADYIADVNKTGVITAVYQSMNLPDKTMDNTMAVTIYRIVQELVNNTVKHAAAKQVLGQLFAEGSSLIVNVEDDGNGFDISKIDNEEGMGWKNIRSRVDFLKGKLDVTSSADSGTFVNMVFNI